MNKALIMISFLSFSFYNSQLSKVEELDNTYNQKFKQLSDKYEKMYNIERKKEEVQIIMERLAGYELAIKTIQKDEPKVDLKTFKNRFTKPPEYETGINGFRSLIAQHFNTSAVTIEDGIVRTGTRFLVDEKGNVSNVTAVGDYREFNLLTIITLYQILNKGKWKPAELDGIPIQSMLLIPITMQFE